MGSTVVTVGNSYWELLVMLTLVITLGVASLAAGQLPDHLKALCPAYPNCDNALLAAYDKIHKASLIQAPAGAPQAPVQTSAELPCANYPFCDVNHAALAQGVPCANFPNCDLHHVANAQRGKRQAASPVTPGNIPGLVPGSEAARQWSTAQLIHQGQLAHHQGKREAPAAVHLTPGNIPGLVPGSEAARQWWTAQLFHQEQLAHHQGKREAPAASVPLTPGNIAGLVPGSEAARQWWTAQLIHQGQHAHHQGKREAPAAVHLTP